MTVQRSGRRRTVALQVAPGAVTLYAPARLTAAQLQTILDTRRDWVARHLAEFAARPAGRPAPHEGQRLPFLGEDLQLRLSPAVRAPLRDGQQLILPAAGPEAALEIWTRRACAAPYRTLVAHYAARLGAADRLGRVTVSGARTRWGSCAARGDIRLHWKLSRAPLPVLHYVALHEAAHLLELNHSARYWAHVARVMPDWAAHRVWLKAYGHTL
ncbi:M48 family metallopeptidase [Deinococcus arcticus]|uniref:M48 family metallopeptidase n=1 Tax=Deinococcus arcticus TaxID=2136176 RepID=UPI001E4F46C6|nr:SprT family zinc-dependent metalloprotease [Deinococcus arcticus]